MRLNNIVTTVNFNLTVAVGFVQRGIYRVYGYKFRPDWNTPTK